MTDLRLWVLDRLGAVEIERYRAVAAKLEEALQKHTDARIEASRAKTALSKALRRIEALTSGPCPRDTDGDGDCGQPACPHCGKEWKD